MEDLLDNVLLQHLYGYIFKSSMKVSEWFLCRFFYCQRRKLPIVYLTGKFIQRLNGTYLTIYMVRDRIYDSFFLGGQNYWSSCGSMSFFRHGSYGAGPRGSRNKLLYIFPMFKEGFFPYQ